MNPPPDKPPEFPPDLAEVSAAWPCLPTEIKVAILTLTRSARGYYPLIPLPSKRSPIPDIIGRLAKTFRRDIKFNAATCPEYDRMDENAREELGRKWVEYVTDVINELDSLKG